MSIQLQGVAYLLASVALWTVGIRFFRRRPAPAWVARVVDGEGGRLLRFAYYIGFPYLTVVLGVVPVGYLGLRGLGRIPDSSWVMTRFSDRLRAQVSSILLTWLPDIGPTIDALVWVAGGLALLWLAYVVFSHTGYRGSSVSEESLPAWRQPLLEVVYQQVHWGFYRGAIWVLSGDLYVGAIGAILLVVAEWMLGADWIGRAHQHPDAESLLLDASLLVATSTVFCFVPNLWFLIPVHWLLSVLCRVILRRGSTCQWTELAES